VRRTLLLDAALDLFAANGYHSTSIEQICQAAYVGTKSFYEVFENREDCYIALLQRITERAMATMVDALAEAPDDETGATELLVASFAHAFLDDPRLAKATFGAAGGLSPAVERQRRTNRRWAAAYIESMWQKFGAPIDDVPVDRHRMAVGLIGGMFDLIADWMLESDVDDASEVDALIHDLTDFAIVVRTGLVAQAVRQG
jgi:AcrR family transcriptional regulator